MLRVQKHAVMQTTPNTNIPFTLTGYEPNLLAVAYTLCVTITSLQA